ncbi:ABC transporter ATP-binding protein [bacterium]|nr:ABC transporter ATP-binding protein [bacterium]
MSASVIIFNHVSKSYPQYQHMTGGFKQFLFNLPGSLSSFRKTQFDSLIDIEGGIFEGETFGIIGNNGAGKSTTLGLIAGVLKPTKGEVIVKKRVSPLLELGAGFHHDLTGKENIYLNGILMGMTRKEVECKIDEIIDFSELGDFIEQPLRIYSSGMLARLGFSVVACLDPEILLIDEILSVGDVEFQKKCINRIMAFREKGVTIVFVSHDLGQVEKICDRVAWVDNHRIKIGGIPGDVIKAYLEANAAQAG